MLNPEKFNLLGTWWALLILPLGLAFIGTGLKAMAKGGLKWEQAYMGADFALAALTSAFILACDRARKLGAMAPPTSIASPKGDKSAVVAGSDAMASSLHLAAEIGNALSVCTLAFFLLVIVLMFQQKFEKDNALESKTAKWVLGGLCNVFGLAPFIMFIVVFGWG